MYSCFIVALLHDALEAYLLYHKNENYDSSLQVMTKHSSTKTLLTAHDKARNRFPFILAFIIY